LDDPTLGDLQKEQLPEVRTFMESRLRITIRAFCILSFLLLPGLSRESHAALIELDNDVVIDWQQKAYANFLPTVVNGNFTVNNADELTAVLISIVVQRTDLLGGFDLTLNVFDPLSQPLPGQYEAILLNGSALKLTFASGKNNSGQLLDNITDPDFTKPTYNKQWTLNDFVNPLQTFDEENGVWTGTSTYELLLGLLANGPLGFSLDGHFYGSNSLPVDLACQQDPTVCKKFPGSASVTESGGQPIATPEPGSLSLLLAGIISVAGVRRRRR